MSYFAKKFSNCKNYEGNIRICESCAHYDHPVTVFNRITESPEVLADKLVYWEHDECDGWWVSNIIDGKFYTHEEVIAATVAKLKEVYK